MHENAYFYLCQWWIGPCFKLFFILTRKHKCYLWSWNLYSFFRKEMSVQQRATWKTLHGFSWSSHWMVTQEWGWGSCDEVVCHGSGCEGLGSHREAPWVPKPTPHVYLNCPRAGKFLSHGSRWLSPPSARSPPQPRACGNFSRLSKLAPSNTLLFPSCSHRVPNKQACVTNNNGAGLSPW